MPSPVGHALAGYAVGALIAGKPTLGTGARLWPPPPLMIGWAALGCAADIDFLFGAHSMYTHSMGAALIVALALAAFRVPLRLVLAEETFNFALAALFNILFAGVTFILYGLAIA